ncbi:cyclic GMP-AMP synthase-like [Tribolium madens]|uniref:cyclic GMP-AMP synthase-like n=1 Tax=Tribolium madens TaxID=41895 RepID=UPI001CF73B6A|nr:cyclic GMP-AMP synthase-like [Tribolium madens]
MTETKKYLYLENTLNEINSKFISLQDKEVKRNNQILESILKTFIDKMKEKDPLFKKMFSRVFYGGSYYDGLRVGKPEEFDLDLLLSVPKYAEPTIIVSKVPGFVHLKLGNYDGFMRQPEANPTFRTFGNLFDKEYFLDTDKVLSWMEGIVQKAMNDFPQKGPKRVVSNSNGAFEVIVHKAGPALTLKISGSGMAMDVDLVTCFIFHGDMWPKPGFKSNPVKTKPDFFIVPKKPKTEVGQSSRHWRLSFQEQERVLIDNKRTLKPTIKLLKKLRDNLQHSAVASYYIKTVLLHIADKKPEEFWRNPLSYVFVTVLIEYKDCIEKGRIPYYWNTSNNLLGRVNAKNLENMANRLKAIISDIEKKKDEPHAIAKYFLNSKDYNVYMMGKMKL